MSCILRFVPALALLGVAGAAPGADAEDNWRPMWLALDFPRLNQIAILVTPFDSLTTESGLTERIVRDAVELALRRNKISPAPPDAPRVVPKLEVDVSAMTVRTTKGKYVLDVWGLLIAYEAHVGNMGHPGSRRARGTQIKVMRTPTGPGGGAGRCRCRAAPRGGGDRCARE